MFLLTVLRQMITALARAADERLWEEEETA